jgi:hypothetical protein
MPDGMIDIDAPATENINAVAKAKGVSGRPGRRLYPRPAAPCTR